MKMKQVSKSIKEMQLALSNADSKKGMLDWKLTKAQAAIELYLYNFDREYFVHVVVANRHNKTVAQQQKQNRAMDYISHWSIRYLEKELMLAKEITDLEDRREAVRELQQTLDGMQWSLAHLGTD
jgi:hypothetical protein|tara:strand:+ start:89 stop:463 length:375 start_codon:yes stop_codon:yes gene_type:complete